MTKEKKEVERQGVGEIGSWKTNDEGKWESQKNEKIREAMSNGFSITRKVAVSSREDRLWERWEGIGKKERRIKDLVEEGEYGKWIYLTGFGNEWKLYKNAGILESKDGDNCFEKEEIRLVDSFKHHGKLYCFYKDDQLFSAIIGSPNLSFLITKKHKKSKLYEIGEQIYKPSSLKKYRKHIAKLKSDRFSKDMTFLERYKVVETIEKFKGEIIIRKTRITYIKNY